MKCKKLLSFFLLIVIIQSCKKEEENYLYGLNKAYVNVYGDYARIESHFIHKGSHPISEKGIIIGKENDVSLDNFLKKEYSNTGNFDTNEPIRVVFTDLDLNTVHYTKAFVVDSKGQISYSPVESFLTSCTDVDSILPREANNNSTIYIYGKYFGADPSKINIEFYTDDESRSAYYNKTVTDELITVTFNPSGYVPDFTIGDEIYVSVRKSDCSNYTSTTYEKGSFIYE